MLAKKVVRWGFVVALACSASAQAAITFVADYSNEGATEGFNDATLGAQRKAAFQFALNIWGTKLQNSYLGETIRVMATFDNLGGTASSAVLGSAGPAGLNANYSPPVNPKYQTNTWYAAALANHIKQSDLYTSGSGNEISAQFNSDVDNATVLGSKDFYYGTDGNAGSDSENRAFAPVWADDDTISYLRGNGGWSARIMTVPVKGGKPDLILPVTALKGGNNIHIAGWTK